MITQSLSSWCLGAWGCLCWFTENDHHPHSATTTAAHQCRGWWLRSPRNNRSGHPSSSVCGLTNESSLHALLESGQFIRERNNEAKRTWGTMLFQKILSSHLIFFLCWLLEYVGQLKSNILVIFHIKQVPFF